MDKKKYEIIILLGRGEEIAYTNTFSAEEIGAIVQRARNFPSMANFRIPAGPNSMRFFNPIHIASITVTEIEDED